MSFFSAPLLLILVCLCLAITGCVGDHRYPATDIVVSKYDSLGAKIWSTTIDNGKNDYATDIIETPDGGYAVAGWIDDDHGMSARPRVVRLDSSGRILWDLTLEPSGIYSVAIAGAADGGFVAAISLNNYDSGEIVKIDADGYTIWNRTFNSAFHAIIPVGDDRFALAGTRTLLINGNGTVVLDPQIPSASIFQAADGGFYLDQSGVPYTIASVYRLDSNGTVIWSRPVGSRENGKIASLFENSRGDIEVVYTYWDSKKDKGLVMYMESDLVTIDKDGNISTTRSLSAVDPVCRTTDGGFAFLAYPFPDSAAYTTLPHADSTLHMVRLSPEGAVIDDRPLNVSQWNAPKAIIPARDSGFVTVIVNGA